MGTNDVLNLFQGVSTLLQSEPLIMFTRIGLMLLGGLLIYLGKKEVLEPLLMIPMGLGMAAINAGILFMPDHTQGNLFLDPLVTNPTDLINILQINFLQPDLHIHFQQWSYCMFCVHGYRCFT